MTPPLDTNKGEPMKTLPEILDPILVKLYYNGYTDRIAGITEHAEAVKNNWLSEAQEAIAKELMGCLPEKRELFEPVTKRPVTGVGDKVGIDLDADTRGSLKFIQDNGFNMAIAEVRARLTAFIGEEVR